MTGPIFAMSFRARCFRRLATEYELGGYRHLAELSWQHFGHALRCDSEPHPLLPPEGSSR